MAKPNAPPRRRDPAPPPASREPHAPDRDDTPPEPPAPESGGTWLRDPSTGALQRISS